MLFSSEFLVLKASFTGLTYKTANDLSNPLHTKASYAFNSFLTLIFLNILVKTSLFGMFKNLGIEAVILSAVSRLSSVMVSI